MKATLFAALMLAVCPALRADAPALVSESNPVVEGKGVVEILLADGTARRVRKILGFTADALRVMTDDGIGKIPLAALHPQSLAKVNSMRESPEEQQARLQREAAAAQSYRENQALRERLAAEENAMVGASQRAEAARQGAAQQAAAEAYARQQQYLTEVMKTQEAQRAERKAEMAERARIEEAESQRQYLQQVAAQQARQAWLAQQEQATAAIMQEQAAAQRQSMASVPGPLAVMMPANIQAASGVSKLDDIDQRALQSWVTIPNGMAPVTNSWTQKLDAAERAVLVEWMNKKRDALNAAVAASNPQDPPTVPADSWIQGADFTGFAKGKVFHLGNGQAWKQIDDTAANYRPDMSGNVVKVHVNSNTGGNYTMTVQGAGEILVMPAQ